MAIKWYADVIIKQVKKANRKALQNVGRIIAREAKALCPEGEEIKFVALTGKNAGKNFSGRIPGTLRKSIRYRVTRKADKVQIIAGGRSGQYLSAFYAMWVEWGRVGMLARPFLRPALEKCREEAEIQFNDLI